MSQFECDGILKVAHALLSQEGSAIRQDRASGGSQGRPINTAHWNPLSRDLDFVSITLSPLTQGDVALAESSK